MVNFRKSSHKLCDLICLKANLEILFLELRGQSLDLIRLFIYKTKLFLSVLLELPQTEVRLLELGLELEVGGLEVGKLSLLIRELLFTNLKPHLKRFTTLNNFRLLPRLEL